MKRPKRCPECRHDKIIELVWGMPYDQQLAKKRIKAGEIKLCGCVITGDSRRWKCAKCKHKWGKL